MQPHFYAEYSMKFITFLIRQFRNQTDVSFL